VALCKDNIKFAAGRQSLCSEKKVQRITKSSNKVSSSQADFNRGEVQMNSRFSLSVFTIEINGKPTLAVQAKRHREVEVFCEQDWLRADLLALTSNGRPLYDAGASLKVRLARSEEVAVYRQATEAITSSDDFNVVYLVDVDDPTTQPDISEGPEPPAGEDTVQ
jgi:hypothetical protein